MSQHNYVFETVVQQFSHNLVSLKTILTKAKNHADNNKFDSSKFLDLKLAPDMYAFTKQVQMVTDNAKGAAARLAGKEIPVFADNEKTMDELLKRIENTINFLEGFKADDFKNYESQKITFPWNPGKYLEGHEYYQSFAIPNFYFHLTTTYAILRNAGVALSKNDFLGNIAWKNS